MSDHSVTLVPIEAWCYNSPELVRVGKRTDLGLFAEALIYYDKVIVDISNHAQFLEFVSWFVSQDMLADLIELLKQEIIRVHHCAFWTMAVQKEGTYSVWNMQDENQASQETFKSRILYHKDLKNYVAHAKKRARLYKAAEKRVIEVKASSFEDAIENARRDFADPRRCALVMQALVDEVSPLMGWTRPPTVEAKVARLPGRHQVTWNVNLEEISTALGVEANLHLGTPLTATAICNRHLWSAARLHCDLYTGSPMSAVVGDKLYETGSYLGDPRTIVQQLAGEVAFPDIRSLVNSGKFDLKEVLRWRKKAGKFREWLQDESDRDRNAIIAYHNEVARDAGWVKTGRSGVRVLGMLSAAAVGAAVGGKLAGVPGAVVGAGAGEGLKYLLELAAKLRENWRPVVFGKWAEERIRKLTDERKNHGLT